MSGKPAPGSMWWIWMGKSRQSKSQLVRAAYVSQNHTWHTWKLPTGETRKTNGLPQMFESKVNACWWALEREIVMVKANRDMRDQTVKRDAERVYRWCCEYHRAFVDQLAG